jgi:DNA (cytosine-5)-methyltransferase 1
MKTTYVADLFCGAGGTSTGVLQAAHELGLKVDLIAVNHWDLAIATHSENHPKVDHYNADLEGIDPRQVVPSGKLRLLVASPECTHFSRARGGKPMSKQSRASVKYVLSWVNKLDVEDVLIENVPEFQEWGPLHRKGPDKDKPIKNRKGEYFHRFVRKMREIGYTVDWRVLTAADYGDPTTRKRLFIVARKNKPIHWAEPTHHRHGGDMFGARPRWRSAREIIDWSIKGQSIFKREKPLAEKTMQRIWAGLKKYSGKAFVLGQQSGAVARDLDSPLPTVAGAGAISLVEPFIIPFFGEREGQEPRTHSIDEPLQTITSQGAGALVEPFIIQMDNGGRTHPIDEPMPTITSADGWALAEPFIITTNWQATNRSRPRSIDEPLPTAIGHDTIGLVQPFLVEYYGNGQSQSVDEPIGTVTGRDRFALVEPLAFEQDGKRYLLDVRFRMLQPHELARAMSFPKDYRFQGSREQQVKQIGNAVPVSLAKNLSKALLST